MRARENPFRTECVHQVRYRFVEGSWPTLMERLAALDHRAALVGPDGSGKTTLIEDLAPHLTTLGFGVRRIFLNDQQRLPPDGCLAGIGTNDILLVDGADLMPRLAWLRFRRRTRHAGGLIITSHRPGMLPTLIECRTTPELLDGIIVELLGDDCDRRDHLARRLFDEHGGNVRNALRALYDTHAGIVH